MSIAKFPLPRSCPIDCKAGAVYAIILMLFFFALGDNAARAANYALLIGVSGYTNEKIPKLKGPANDVTLMWRVLKKRGFSGERMTVLADGLPAGPEFPSSDDNPTRTAIMGAFSALAQHATAGDLVLIYYSGHGTQQPVQNQQQDPERDNYDQVMLPIDAGTYNDAQPMRKGILNGIVDDEIGAALDKIREHGADVWVIIDACHAGSMTRGLVDGVAVRGVDPAVLGVPPGPAIIASKKTDAAAGWQFTSKRPGTGSLVGFFAVDSSREAIERPFEEFDKPMIGANANRRVGVFTYFLYRALSEPGSIGTYRELAQQLVWTMQGSREHPPAMPSFDGDLNRPLLAVGPAPEPSAWQVKLDGGKVEIPAGALHGITEGSVLKLSSSPEPDGVELATATVTTSYPARSEARLDTPLPSKPPQTVWARIASPGISFTLAVAEPPSAEMMDIAVRRLIDETKAQAAVLNKGAIEWVAAQASADIRLRAQSGRIWILPGDGEWVREDLREQNPRLKRYPLTPSFEITSARAPENLANSLQRVARARNMVRLAEAADPSKRGGTNWKAIKVTGERLTSPGSNRNPDRNCPTLGQLSEQDLRSAKGFDPMLPQTVFHCDLIKISVQNMGSRDVDVNLSYIDSRSGITPLGQQCTVTIPPGGTLNRSLWVTTWDSRRQAPDSVGVEHIVVTAVEQKDGISSNLCFIQDAVRGVEGSKRGPVLRTGRAGWLLTALGQAALASGTRGIKLEEEENAPEPAGAGMYLVTLQVTPSFN